MCQLLSRPFIGLFSFGNMKQNRDTKPVEYGSWDMITPKNYVCELIHYRGVISITDGSTIPVDFFVLLYAKVIYLLIVRPFAQNSRYTTPLESQKTEQKLHQLCPLWEICNVVDVIQQLLNDAHAWSKFSNFGTSLAGTRFMFKTNMPTSLATSQKVIRSLSTI